MSTIALHTAQKSEFILANHEPSATLAIALFAAYLLLQSMLLTTFSGGVLVAVQGLTNTTTTDIVEEAVSFLPRVFRQVTAFFEKPNLPKNTRKIRSGISITAVCGIRG